ncbi:MAG TPA: glucose 1-dehydrogenase [Hyphomonadaceae bacterium]|nr:glucose 1-dehydrogenase [Hyphomonadaceae bacterium]HPN06096.1 glucose 1-dehydrogenase [Hyphomonadaceae bacterium]
MTKLEGRVALVTGGARGLGAAAARALAGEGAKVVISDIGDGNETAKSIGGAYVKHDVTSEADWANAIDFTKKTFGGLDILVNNAGVFWVRPISMTTLEAFKQMQAVNVDGVFLGLKYGIPAIAERSQKWEGGGSIINISSVAGLIGSANTLAYNASKGAVRLMTKGAAIECAEQKLKIRVNSVHPGIIDTPMMDGAIAVISKAAGTDAETEKARMAKRHPLGRVGKDTDIANAVLFLASDASSFMTGSEVVVDGGMTAN